MSENNSPSPYQEAAIAAIGFALLALSAATRANQYALFCGLIALGAVIGTSRLRWRRTIWAQSLAFTAVCVGVILHIAVRASFNAYVVRNVCGFNLSLDESYWYLALIFFALMLSGITTVVHRRFLARRTRFVAPRLRITSLAAFVATSLLLAAAVSSPAPRLDPGHYVESMPAIGMIPVVAGKPVSTKGGYKWITIMSETFNDEVSTYETHLSPDYVARRYCRRITPDIEWKKTGPDCSLVLRKEGPISPADEHECSRPRGITETNPGDSMCLSGRIDLAPNETFTVRDEKQHGLLILDGAARYALDRITFSTRGVTVRDIMAGTSSPLGWLLAATLGWIVAVILKVFRSRASQRLTRIAEADAATLDADGWLVFDNGLPSVFVGTEKGIKAGPVVVLSGGVPRRTHSAYRGNTVPRNAEILPGRRQEVLTREQWHLVAPLDAIALGMLVLGATPLATWWLFMH